VRVPDVVQTDARELTCLYEVVDRSLRTRTRKWQDLRPAAGREVLMANRIGVVVLGMGLVALGRTLRLFGKTEAHMAGAHVDETPSREAVHDFIVFASKYTLDKEALNR
jgi:hypothetical protein